MPAPIFFTDNGRKYKLSWLDDNKTLVRVQYVDGNATLKLEADDFSPANESISAHLDLDVEYYKDSAYRSAWIYRIVGTNQDITDVMNLVEKRFGELSEENAVLRNSIAKLMTTIDTVKKPATRSRVTKAFEPDTADQTGMIA